MKYYIPIRGFKNLFLMLNTQTGDFDFVEGKADLFSRVAAPRIPERALSDIKNLFKYVYGKDLQLANFCFTRVYEKQKTKKGMKL